MIYRIEKILRNQLAANPEVIGPWEVSRPAFVVFAENLGDTDVTLHIKGGQTVNGPFVRQYGSDSLISIPAFSKIVPAVVTDIAKFVALHLQTRSEEGILVELLGYQPLPDHDIATESLTVI